ncbi:MAG: hypothetical protein NVS2B16_33800 [Chloroflexota bacterium]
MASGVISAFAGLVLVGMFGVADPTRGASYVLSPDAVAFLGIAAVQLGRSTVWRICVAVYLLIVATTGLLRIGTDPWGTDACNGAALIVAMTFVRLVGDRKTKIA